MKRQLLFCFAFLSVCACLNAQTLVTNMSSSNGTVYAVYKKGGSYYIGGTFSYVGLNTGYGALSTTANDYPNMNFPQFNAQVYALIPDGSGGWYAGGNFTTVGGIAKAYLAHIKSNNTVDNSFSANCNGAVRTIVKLNGKLYFGGSFSTVNGTTRLYAAAVNATTGALVNGWNPSPNGQVNAITPAFGTDTTLWLGGNFTTVNSANLLRPYLAKVNLTNGNFVTGSVSADNYVNTLTTHGDSVFVGGYFSRLGLKTDYFSSISEGGNTSDQSMPNANSTIRCIIPDGNGGWYVGGSFTQIGNINKNYVAHIKSDKTIDNNFTASANSTVYSIVKDGTKLYLGGAFTSVNSTPRNYLAEVNATTGALITTWDPNANNQVNTLALKDSVIVAGGYFTTIGGQNAFRFGVIKKTDGSLIGGYPGYDNVVQKVSVLGDSILAGGNYTHAAYYSYNSAKVTPTNVKPDPNFPSTNGTIYAVAKDASGNYYVGGSFTTIGGVNQAYIAKLNSSMQVVAGWTPQVNSYVRSIVVVGSTVYIGGLFTTTNTVGRPYISALNTVNPGANKTWNSSLNSYVYTLVTDGTSIYAGGTFTQANGVTARGLLAKFNLSGTLDNTWNPNAAGGGGSVEQLAISGSNILAGGSFTTIGGTTRNYLAKLNNTNGNASNWATANSYVYALYADGANCYLGGYFTQLTPPAGGALTRNYIGVVATSNGAVGGLNPNPNSYVYAISKIGNNIYFGGQFNQVNGTARNYLASTSISGTGTLQSWNPSANSTVNKIYIDSLKNIIIGGNFSGFQQVDRTYASMIKSANQSLTTWAPVLDNVVYDITSNKNRIIIGGAFHTVGGSGRSGLAVLSFGGALQTTNLNLTKGGSTNVTVYSLFASGTKIYVGGDFDKAGSNTRNEFVEADISSGAGSIKPTNPNLDNYVYAISVQDTTIAYGGNFRFSNFTNRTYLAGLRTTTNTVTSWNPLPDSYVFGIAVNYNKIFVVGSFDNINSLAHTGAAAFNLATGALSSTWDPQLSRSGQGYYADLNVVAADSNYVYLGGNFDQVKGTARNNAAIVSASNAAVQSWNTGPNSIVRAIAVNGNNVFVGGDFTFCKGAARSYIAKIDSATGLVNASWNPGANSYVYAITGSGSNIYIGGSFTQLSGVTRTALGAVSASTGTATSFDPVIQSNGSTGNVYTLAFDTANVLYVGGSFNSAKGSTRNNLAALSVSGAGSLKSWNPNANSAVFTIATAGSKIYVGGQFSTLNGSTARNYFACVNNTNGTVTSFNPNMNSYVRALSVSGNTLYASGQFTTVNGGTSRSYTAAYDATAGTLKSWNPVPNSSVYGLAAQTDTVYLGGYFSSLNGSSFNYLAAVKGTAGTANLSSFNPNLGYAVFNEFIAEKTLLVGGQFTTVGGSYRGGFAVFKLPGNNSFSQTNGNSVIAESAVSKQLESKAFSIYPNPAVQTANIQFGKALSGKVVVTLTDMNGNKVLQKDVSGSYMTYIKLDVNTLKNGNYIISVTADNFNERSSLIIAK